MARTLARYALKPRRKLTTRLLRELRMVAFSVAALAVNATAQQAPTASWTNLGQLAPGTEVRVLLSDGKTVRGFLQKATSDSLAINATTSQETLSRQDVKRVLLKRQGHRGRNTLIGLAAGAGGGLALGAAVDHGSSGWFRNFGKAVFTPLGAIVGTVVGVAIPTGGWHEIYRAP
ncbi:MAG TPA: hypothetical protein VE959_17015 [Bryobacteraceae bacterium]|nr:hypothetical protein [Bryobacteraceae bacterium]